MFTIINKPTFLPIAPLLKVDMHSHILPGIDDGAATVEDSLTLIKGMIKMGYEGLIATPHTMSDLYPNTPQSIHSAFEKLQKEMKRHGINIPISYASEYLIDEHFPQKIQEGLLSFGYNLVLIETMFSLLPPNIEDVLFSLRTNRYKPVFAHPERYHYMDDDLKQLKPFQKHGCYIQPNILSFTGYYGSREKHLAHKLLDAGIIDFLGSDIHHIRHLNVISKLTVRRKVAKKLEEIAYKNRELLNIPGPKALKPFNIVPSEID